MRASRTAMPLGLGDAGDRVCVVGLVAQIGRQHIHLVPRRDHRVGRVHEAEAFFGSSASTLARNSGSRSGARCSSNGRPLILVVKRGTAASGSACPPASSAPRRGEPPPAGGSVGPRGSTWRPGPAGRRPVRRDNSVSGRPVMRAMPLDPGQLVGLVQVVGDDLDRAVAESRSASAMAGISSAMAFVPGTTSPGLVAVAVESRRREAEGPRRPARTRLRSAIRAMSSARGVVVAAVAHDVVAQTRRAGSGRRCRRCKGVSIALRYSPNDSHPHGMPSCRAVPGMSSTASIEPVEPVLAARAAPARSRRRSCP